MVTNHKHAGLGRALAVLVIAVSAGAAGTAVPAVEKPPAAVAPLVVAEARTLAREGGRNPTLASDRRSGAVYLAWAQEVPGTAPKDKDGKKADPKLEVRVARSDDGGRSFGPPVVASSPRDRVFSFTVNPTQVAVGPKGEVYVLYPHRHKEPDFTLLWEGSRQVLRLARSDDEGKGFSQPIALLSDDWIPYGDVKLALDAKDNAWVAFEDRRGDEDLIQVAMIATDGRRTLTQAWSGTAPDVAAEGETAIVAWGTQGTGDEETGGGINTRVISLPRSP